MSFGHYSGGKWTRILLIICNNVNLIIGFGVVGVGAWMIYDDLRISPLLGSHLFLIFSMLFVTCGSTIVIVSLLGTYAACRCTRSLQYVFIGLAIMPLCVVIATGSLSLAFKSEMVNIIEEEMQESITESYHDRDVIEGWDTLQKKFSCCGVSGSEDWYDFCNIRITEATPVNEKYNDKPDRRLPDSPRKIQEKVTKRPAIAIKSTTPETKVVPLHDVTTVSAEITHNVTVPDHIISSTIDTDTRKKRSITISQCRVPQSCCKEESCATHNMDSLYDGGCMDAIRMDVMFISMGATGLTVGVLMLLAVLLACRVARKMEDN